MTEAEYHYFIGVAYKFLGEHMPKETAIMVIVGDESVHAISNLNEEGKKKLGHIIAGNNLSYSCERVPVPPLT